MQNYDAYSRMIVRSVSHIFKNFLQDQTIEEILESQAGREDPRVTVSINGKLKGELVLNFPPKTLTHITTHFFQSASGKSAHRHFEEVAGEIANLITGTFANQLQFHNIDVRLSAPEYNEEAMTARSLYDNINLSFNSRFGGFDLDLYYREEG